jgi:hypothetical protein
VEEGEIDGVIHAAYLAQQVEFIFDNLASTIDLVVPARRLRRLNMKIDRCLG